MNSNGLYDISSGENFYQEYLKEDFFMFGDHDNSNNEIYLLHNSQVTNTGISFGDNKNPTPFRISYQDSSGSSGATLSSITSVTIDTPQFILPNLHDTSLNEPYKLLVVNSSGVVETTTSINTIIQNIEINIKNIDEDLKNIKLHIQSLDKTVTNIETNMKSYKKLFIIIVIILAIMLLFLIIVCIILFCNLYYTNKNLHIIQDKFDHLHNDMNLLHKSITKIVEHKTGVQLSENVSNTNDIS
jgi:hypothetical protein